MLLLLHTSSFMQNVCMKTSELDSKANFALQFLFLPTFLLGVVFTSVMWCYHSNMRFLMSKLPIKLNDI